MAESPSTRVANSSRHGAGGRVLATMGHKCTQLGVQVHSSSSTLSTQFYDQSQQPRAEKWRLFSQYDGISRLFIIYCGRYLRADVKSISDKSLYVRDSSYTRKKSFLHLRWRKILLVFLSSQQRAVKIILMQLRLAEMKIDNYRQNVTRLVTVTNKVLTDNRRQERCLDQDKKK